MRQDRYPRRTLRYIRMHWPLYFTLYGALVLAMLLVGMGLSLSWYSFIPIALAIFLVAAYFLVSSLYIAFQLNDGMGGTAAEILFDLAQTRPDHRVVCIDLGLRETAVSIAQRLTAGEVTVVDIYNPQSNTGSSLRRARERRRKPPSDPRLNWIDGTLDLLPLPDRSASAVYMNQILSEFWLPEEREKLLEEARRILIPEGRLLIAERIRGQTDFILSGLLTYTLPTDEEWRMLLERSGFVVQREQRASGLLYCARADKPSPTAGKQMSLNLEYV